MGAGDSTEFSGKFFIELLNKIEILILAFPITVKMFPTAVIDVADRQDRAGEGGAGVIIFRPIPPQSPVAALNTSGSNVPRSSEMAA